MNKSQSHKKREQLLMLSSAWAQLDPGKPGSGGAGKTQASPGVAHPLPRCLSLRDLRDLYLLLKSYELADVVFKLVSGTLHGHQIFLLLQQGAAQDLLIFFQL
jgi:hypothetical protein